MPTLAGLVGATGSGMESAAVGSGEISRTLAPLCALSGSKAARNGTPTANQGRSPTISRLILTQFTLMMVGRAWPIGLEASGALAAGDLSKRLALLLAGSGSKATTNGGSIANPRRNPTISRHVLTSVMPMLAGGDGTIGSASPRCSPSKKLALLFARSDSKTAKSGRPIVSRRKSPRTSRTHLISITLTKAGRDGAIGSATSTAGVLSTKLAPLRPASGSKPGRNGGLIVSPAKRPRTSRYVLNQSMPKLAGRGGTIGWALDARCFPSKKLVPLGAACNSKVGVTGVNIAGLGKNSMTFRLRRK